MYDFSLDVSLRPEPFFRYTAKELWTRPHLSKQMLDFHLNQETDLASRRIDTINQVVRWIDGQPGLSEKNICDLGCGPGLYAQRFSDLGAGTTGVDFSQRALDYARSSTNRAIQYVHADYLSDELPSGFDVITLIYTDFCVLSPQQRNLLLGRIRRMLNAGGHLVFDVLGTGLFQARKETTLIEHRLMNGFWAAGDYVGIRKSFTYQEPRLGLDRFVVVEPEETWEIYNWFQYFTPESISAEVNASGFDVVALSGDLTGLPLADDGDLIGVVATKESA